MTGRCGNERITDTDPVTRAEITAMQATLLCDIAPYGKNFEESHEIIEHRTFVTISHPGIEFGNADRGNRLSSRVLLQNTFCVGPAAQVIDEDIAIE